MSGPEQDQRGVLVALYRYENALRWIRTIAGMHYFGAAFDPEHMRDLANVAADALNGKDLPDHEQTIERSREKAREWAEKFARDLIDDGDDRDPQ